MATVLGLVSADMIYPQMGPFLVGPLVSVPFFVPVLLLDRNISGLKNIEMGGWSHSSTRAHAYLLEEVSTGSISLFTENFS